jgi:hypothetical protein
VISKEFEYLLQRTKIRRQAAKDFCEDIGISLNDAMAMLDTDYASEPQTCESDTELSEDTVDRRMKSGLGQVAKKAVGFEWRSPDVSEEQLFMPENSPSYQVCCLPSLADI